MKWLSLLVPCAFAGVFVAACSDGDPITCASDYGSKSAVEVRLSEVPCEVTGTATRVAEFDAEGALVELDEPETFELSCETDEERERCVCAAGENFGRYEVTLVEKSGETDTAIIDVMREAPPVCFDRDVVEPFGEGGAGGAGGAGPAPGR